MTARSSATEDLTEAEIAEFEASVGEIIQPEDVLPFEPTPSVEVGGDLEAAVEEEHEIARAEGEGLPPVPEPHITMEGFRSYPIAEDEDSAATQIALGELWETQDRLKEAISDHAGKAEAAKNAKKRVESLVEELDEAVTRLRDLKNAATPDPMRFPLFDKAAPTSDPAKLAINEMFPAPVPIQPTPAGTIEEFFRRKRRDTRLDSLGLTSKVDEILKVAGYHTILDLDKIFEASHDLCTISIPGTGAITEKRQETILDAIAELAAKWKAEWNVLHPEDNPGFEESEPLTEDADAEDGTEG